MDRLAAVGDLHRLACPRCGHRTLVQAPLLLVRPSAAHPLTLQVGRLVKEREIEAVVGDLVDRLRTSAERLLDGSWFQRSAARMKGLGRQGHPIWDESWLEDLQIVIDPSGDELDIEAEAETEEDAYFEEILLMEQTLIALTSAGSLDQKKQFIHAHPILLRPEIDAVVARMRDKARTEGFGDSAALLEVYRMVLFACREYGIERAFHEIEGSADSPDRQVTSYCDAASQLINRFEASGDLSDLDMALIAIEKAQKLIAETAVQMDLHTRVLNEGARLLLWRSSCTGSTPDLDRAISMLTEALLNAGNNSRKRGLYLGNLGSAYGSRYKLMGDPDDLDRAVSLHRDSLQEELDGPRRRASALSSLGLGLNMRFALSSRLEDLEEAVRVSREAAALAPADSLEGIAVLGRLATTLLARHERLRQAEDLEEAVDLAERAAAATPEDSPDYLRNLGILSTAKMERYTLYENLGDLERSIELGQTIVHRSSEGSPDVPSVCRDLCQALQSRYARLGDPADLDLAVGFGERAVAQTPIENPDRALSLAGLADARSSRFQRTGHLEDLTQSLELYHAAMESFAVKSKLYFNVCSNYGTALLDHHQSSGSMESLQEYIDVMRSVIRHTPPAMVGAETYKLNLAVGLVKRGTTLQVSKDLREAVEICVAILAHETVTPSVRMTAVYTLCSARLELVDESGDLQTLNQAIDDAKLAVGSVLATQPSRIPWVSLLASCLSKRFSLSRNLEDLNEAITWQTSALSSAEKWGTLIEPQRVNLADSLLSRFETSRQPTDAQEALRHYRLVCTSGAQQPEFVVMASRAWANWCLKEGHWPDAVEAAAFGLRAAERLHDTQPSLSGKTAWLGALGGLYLDATCALARTGDLTGAVATMERGRAKLLSDSLDLRQGSLDAVRTTRPELVPRFERALEQLRQTEQVESEPWWDFDRCEQLRAVRRSAHESLGSLIQEIRTLPGQDRFLKPPDFREIAQSLEDGVPVVYLAPSVGGTVALFVRRIGTRVQVKASWADALTQKTLFTLLMGPGEEPDERGLIGAMRRVAAEGSTEARLHLCEVLDTVTSRTWDLLMSAVVQHLEAWEATEVVLVPGGLLGLLPLHAARASGPGASSVLDRIACRYAPSVRALRHSREGAQRSPTGAALAVFDPQPVDTPRLRFTAVEAAWLCSVFEESRTLSGTAAARDRVLQALRSVNVAHFACHGVLHWENPLLSGLVLADDHVLTVADLLGLRGAGGRLVVLSACQSGVANTRLPDELLSLPMAFLQAGFAGVVASLWTVGDLATTLLMVRFYLAWRLESLPPAQALRVAQLWMRDTNDTGKIQYLEGWLSRDVMSPGAPLTSAQSKALQQALPVLEMELSRRSTTSARPELSQSISWAAFTYTGA